MPRSAKTVRGVPASRRRASVAVKSGRGARPAKSARLYHHGALREALLKAAERLLERNGVQGLTLRAAAREAGVSHAAPKHHFGDLSGLLTELAIIGFERFRNYLAAGLRDDLSPPEKLGAIGRGYVAFAKAHPGLFLMMFRSERLDMSRPALRAATRASQEVLESALGQGGAGGERLTLEAAGRIASAWSLVHGFSILLIDGRWRPLLARLPEGTTAEDLLEAVIDPAGPARGPDPF